jgi:hypothetical protein
MYRDILTNKWILGGLCFLVVFTGVCYLYYQHETVLLRQQATESNEIIQPSEKQQTAETANPTKAAADAPVDSITPTTEKPINDITTGVAKNVHTSSNPMFAGGIPKHLQCPEEWIGMYSREFKGDRHDIGRISQPRIDEILSKYNPHRPLTEVWPLFIAAEKYYYGNADPERATPGQGRGRFDWAYQNLLDFPEVFVLSVTDVTQYKERFEILKDYDHFETMRQVAIGHWDPDLNLHKLQDDRELRTKTGYRYEVIAERMGVNTKGQMLAASTGLGFGHSGKNAELIKIYLADTSDEELEQLGGWNYNIDPYATSLYTLPEDATERVLEINRSAYGGLKK